MTKKEIIEKLKELRYGYAPVTMIDENGTWIKVSELDKIINSN